ncbi:MAG: hypothetical protein A2Y62_05835 [Candidatus Fischerbacteria bacterium RBG_13_37_8]|uniref:DUF4276 family protein n=1 Tax=Candidatus Fischerbacteria bacterium RBG_13_37_8 TaxID=1817863 RepID=A0A1F5VEN6_9BACT|nr:MAG: hypothetical protein A2Y62_05835 [Candidatus Fischerbacteria bacterium RBG_13_37_8]
MKIALIGEGKNDKEVIPVFIKKIFQPYNIDPSIIARKVPRGDLFSSHKIRAYLEKDILAKHSRIDKAIICVDSECSDENEITDKAKLIEKELADINPQPIYIVLIHALEGWLLADTEAIESYLATKINIKPSDALVCKPKEMLSSIFRKAGKDFDYMRDNPRIAQLCNPDRIIMNNKSILALIKIAESD